MIRDINMLELMLNDEKVLKVIEFGSTVYGSRTKDSDTDYIVVTTDDVIIKEISCNNKDFQLYPISIWKTMCSLNDIKCIEAYFCDDKHWLKGKRDDIKLNYTYIRSGFSTIASNSWVKCKKKLTIEEDYNPWIAKKSLFHSLRIILFGIQIMKYGKIVSFREANIYFDQIMVCYDDWEELKEKFQPTYNKLKTEFRLAHEERRKREYLK